MGTEQYFESFQSISQRRRNGVLTVTGPAGKTQMHCIEGRVVSVTQDQLPTSIGIAQRLYNAGLLHERAYSLVQRKAVPVDQLFDMLVGKQFVSEEQFLRARSAHEMNIALSLRIIEDPLVEFASRDVRSDLRYPWSVSPGELLLDMCELESDSERFFRFLMPVDDTEVLVRATGELPRTSSPAERLLFERLQQPRDVRTLFAGLLNEAEVTEGLLTLIELGLLEVYRGSNSAPAVAEKPEARRSARAEAAPSPVEPNGGDDLELAPEIDGTSAMYDKIASDVIGSMLDGFEDLTLAVFQEEGIPPVREAAPAPSVLPPEPQHAPARERAVPTTRAERPRPVEESRSLTVPSEAPVPAQLIPPPLAAGGSAPASCAPTEYVDRRTRHDRIVEMNIAWMSREMRERLAVGTVFVFLVLFLLCSLTQRGPIETWLHSLEQFTSGASFSMVE